MATDCRARPRATPFALAVLGALAACTSAPTAPVAPAVGAAAAAAPVGFPAQRYEARPEAGGRVYRIEADQSEIDIYVYRGGRLARFGHNHIVTSRDLAGYVFLASGQAGSQLDLYFPVDTLSIDEPALRAAAGDDFASQPSAEDIAGTRRNMLGEKLLDAVNYPHVLVSGSAKGGTAGALELDLTVTVRGGAHTLRTTVPIEVAGDTLRASGEIELSHAALGLTPFAALGGAIAVQDVFDLRYRITARASGQN